MQDLEPTLSNSPEPLTMTAHQRGLLADLPAFLKGPEAVLILRGPAGTGKTTLIREISQRLSERRIPVVLMAPTGRAARILQQRTGRPASTMHRFLYQHHACKQFSIEGHAHTETYRMVFHLRANTDSADTVYLVDEASMVSDVFQDDEFFQHGSGRLLKDLFHYVNPDHNDHHRKIIFVGDPCQLPPVGSNQSPAMNAAYLHKEFGLSCRVYELNEVVRQNAESGILKHAWDLRDAIESQQFRRLDLCPIPPDVRHVDMEDILQSAGPEDMLIGFSNTRVNQLNRMIREHRNGNPPHPLPGERMLCVRNLYRFQQPLMNGDLAEVVDASPEVTTRVVPLNKPVNGVKKIVPITLRFRSIRLRWPTDQGEWIEESMMINENLLWSGAPRPDSDECKALYVDFLLRHKDLKPGTETFTEALRNDAWFNCAQIKFGYAVTCHKAQGGEWDQVFVDFEGRRNMDLETFRWIYTALTRARKTLGLMHPPRVTALTPACPLPETDLLRTAHVPPPASSSWRDQLQSLLEAEGVTLEALAEQQFAFACTLCRGEETAKLRILYNGKGIITRIQPQRTPASELEQSLMKRLDVLLHQPLQAQVENKAEITGLPSHGQSEFLEDLQTNVHASTYHWLGARIHTPYHLEFTVGGENSTQRFDVWHNQQGRLKKVSPLTGSLPPCASAYLCLADLLEFPAP